MSGRLYPRWEAHAIGIPLDSQFSFLFHFNKSMVLLICTEWSTPGCPKQLLILHPTQNCRSSIITLTTEMEVKQTQIWKDLKHWRRHWVSQDGFCMKPPPRLNLISSSPSPLVPVLLFPGVIPTPVPKYQAHGSSSITIHFANYKCSTHVHPPTVLSFPNPTVKVS